MQEVTTKTYEATMDFTLASVTETGEQAGDVQYQAGVKYSLPEQVAAMAPEGALKEVQEAPPAPETPSAPLPSEPAAKPEPVKAPSSGFVGGHSMRDR